MNTDEVIKILKDRLSIDIEFEEGGNAYWSGCHKLTVNLKLDDETISSSMAYLPNDKRGSEY